MPWRIIPLMMAFVALAHFNRVCISVAGAEKIIADDFITAKQMGLVYSAFLFSYTLLMIPGGWFIDRVGPRLGWVVVGFGSSAGALLTGAAGLALLAPMSLLAGLLVVRSLMGCTNAPLHPTGARLVANWVPPSGASLANGLLNCAACAGMAATPIVFGLMMDRFGWPGAFVAAGAATAVLALVWSLVAADHPPGFAATRPEMELPSAEPPAPTEVTRLPSDVAAPRLLASDDRKSRGIDLSESQAIAAIARPFPLLRLLADRRLLCLALSYGMVGYFQYLFFYWAQYYFEGIRAMPKNDARLITGLLTLSMGAGMVVGGWLSDRMAAFVGQRYALAVIPVGGLLLGAAATVLGVLQSDPAWIGGAFAVAMAAVGLGEGAFWTASVRIGGMRGGTAAAILNTGGNAGGLLAPLLTPFISAAFGWQVGLGVASVACVLAAVLWVGAIPESR